MARPKFFTYQGRTLTLTGWSQILGITRQALSARLRSYPPEVALDPHGPRRPRAGRPAMRYTYEGRTRTAKQWAAALNVSLDTIYRRIEHQRDLRGADKKPGGHKPIRVEFDGTTLTISEWAEVVGVTPNTIRARFKAGVPLDGSTLDPSDKELHP